jgi:hypothetical protein
MVVFAFPNIGMDFFDFAVDMQGKYIVAGGG